VQSRFTMRVDLLLSRMAGSDPTGIPALAWATQARVVAAGQAHGENVAEIVTSAARQETEAD